MKFSILTRDYDNNQRTASFAGGVNNSANEAFSSKWNQLLGLTKARRSTCC
jgi:hypothetical protein